MSSCLSLLLLQDVQVLRWLMFMSQFGTFWRLSEIQVCLGSWWEKNSPSSVSSLNAFLSLSWWELSLTLISPLSVHAFIVAFMKTDWLLSQPFSGPLRWYNSVCPENSGHFLSSSTSLSSRRCSTNEPKEKLYRTKWDKSQKSGRRQWSGAWNMALFNRLITFNFSLEEWIEAGGDHVHIHSIVSLCSHTFWIIWLLSVTEKSELSLKNNI